MQHFHILNHPNHPRSVIAYSMQPAKKHVAIIGAGYAGLAAARTLLASSQVDVTLFEATNRVGGRACTGLLPITKAPVELGATWFHGTQLNPVYDLAVKYGIVKPQAAAAAAAPVAAAAAHNGQTDSSVETKIADSATAAAVPEQPDLATAAAAAPAAPLPSNTNCSCSSSSSSADPTGNAAGGPLSDHNNKRDESNSIKQNNNNSDDSDSRWELLLCAPGQMEPLSGPQKAAALEAFQQYSSVLEEAEELVGQITSLRNAESAAAAAEVAGVSLHDQQQQQQGDQAAAAAGGGGVTLGHLLRQRFDQVMNAADQAAGAAAAEDHGSSPKQQQQQQQQDRGEQSDRARDLATSQATQQAFVDGWACRERLQRAYDGFHSTDAAGITHALEYIDLDGPNIPVPGGYQALAETLATEVIQSGCNMLFNTPVDQIYWIRSDHKVGVHIAAAAAGSSSDVMVFDAVIVTWSLGVLKARARDVFQPQLPENKLAAIKHLQIGQVEKLFVEWPAAAAAGGNGDNQQHDHKQSDHTFLPQQQQQQRQQQQQTTVVVGTGLNLVGPRKPKTQMHDFQMQKSDSTAAAAAGSGSSSSGTVFTTYCLMWPSRRDLWGFKWQQQQHQGQQQQEHSLELDIPQADPVYVDCFTDSSSSIGSSNEEYRGHVADSQLWQQQQRLWRQQQLPSWLLGVHSWRYGDGPEWIKPAAAATAAAFGSSDLQQQQQQQQHAPNRSAVVWVTGRAAVEVGHLQVLQDLEHLLQSYPAIPTPNVLFNSHVTSDQILDNCHLLRSDWSTNEYFRGSYSYPGLQATGQSADDLAAPLTAAAASSSSSDQAVVCFAGEATSRHYMGTVHGAFISGVREAERLLKQWNL